MNATLITSPHGPLTQETALARLRVRARTAQCGSDAIAQAYGQQLTIVLDCLDNLRVRGTKQTVRELWRTARMIADRLDTPVPLAPLVTPF